MTTIAYNHKDREVAVDSRATRGNLIDSDNDNKAVERNGVVFILTGAGCDTELLISHYEGSPINNLIPECKAIVIDDGRFFEFWVNEEGNACTEELVSNTAFGSGGNFALAGMDFGLSAKKAVKYAMTRDCKTGGKVRVFKAE